MNSIFLTVKHDFCSLDTPSWVLHNHIRSPFKMSRMGEFSLAYILVPLFFPQSEGTVIFYPCLIVSPFSIYTFLRQISPICGAKCVTFSNGRGPSPRLPFPPFPCGFQKFWFRYMATRGKEGSENSEEPDGGMGATQYLRFLSRV